MHRKQKLGWPGLALALVMAASPLVMAAPGSWVGETRGVRLFTPDRLVESAPMTPPGSLAQGGLIQRVSWRFEVPAGQPWPQAWLCVARDCTTLKSSRGSSHALAGLAADHPLHFRFRLPPGRQPERAFRIEGLQVIVDYR